MSQNKLAVNPNDTASIVTVAIGSVGQNPYRDMVMFPIQEDKIASLIESIEKTGFWPSIIARPLNNEIDGKVIDREALEALISSGYDFSSVVWEKAFAHHRQAACEKLGFTTIPIIPQIVSDENMLLMMANENKDGFGSNINSQLETVRQVKARLEDSIKDYDDYEAYKTDGGEFFATQKSFKNAQTQGVGFKTIKRFLGETWSDRDVRGPVAVLKAVEDNLFHQEDIVDVPTIGLLEGISSIARTLYEGFTPKEKGAELVPAVDWPEYYKTKCMEDIIARCQLSDTKHESTVTVAQLDKARLALQKEGVNPASFLRSGKGKKAFDIYEAAKAEFIIADAELEVNMAAIQDLPEMDGFASWDGLEELMEKLQKSAKNLAEGIAEATAPEGAEGLDATTEGDLNSAINGDESALEGIDMETAFGELPADSGTAPINQLTSTVLISCEVIGAQIEALASRGAEVEADEDYTMAITALLGSVAKLAMNTIGKHALTDAFKSATAVEEVGEIVEEA